MGSKNSSKRLRVRIGPENLRGYCQHCDVQERIPLNIVEIADAKLQLEKKGGLGVRASLNRYYELVTENIIEQYHCHKCSVQEPHFKHEFTGNNYEKVMKLFDGVKQLPTQWLKAYFKYKPLPDAGFGFTALRSMDFPQISTTGVNTCLDKIRGGLSAECVYPTNTHEILYQYVMCAFEHYGKKRYFATKQLTQELANTVFEDVDIDDVLFPAQAFCIYFEKGGFTYTLDDGKKCSLVAAYVAEDEDVRLTPLGGETIPEGVDYSKGRCWNFILEITRENEEYYYIPFNSQFSPSGKLSKVIGDRNKLDGVDTHMRYHFIQHVLAYNLLINTILYITNSEDVRYNQDLNSEYETLRERMVTAKGEKREKIKRRMRDIGANPMLILASTYTIDRSKSVQNAVRGEDKKWKMKVRTLVSGHWRKQPFGEARTKRRLVWVRPFWRGPVDAPISKSMGVLK
jgi:hypothetical protein